MFYRYEIVSNDQRVGLLTGLDDLFTEREVWSLIGPFELYLPGPDVSMSDTRSYFTDDGNRKFRKAIRRIIKRVLDKGLHVDIITKDTLDDILYEDKYQAVVLLTN